MAVGRRGNQLVIDFRVMLPDGRRVRAVEYEGPDTPVNFKRVKAKWVSIEYHQTHNSFSYLDFFPHGSKAKHFEHLASGVTFSAWWERWMASKSLRSETERIYEMIYKKYLEKYFGTTPIANIDQHALLVFRKSLSMQHNTINTYMKPLRQCLKAAVRAGLIADDPGQGIRALSEGRVPIEPFSFDELRHMFDYWHAKDLAVHDMMLFWSRTGVRIGEFMALKWPQVDFFNQKISIVASLQPNGTLGPPKTENSIRDIDMRPAVSDALRRQQARTGLANSFVWADSMGKRWLPHRLRPRFAYWLRLAGIKQRPPKNMRHTFATLHIAAGESITWVSKMLGHSNVTITLEKYNRFVPNLTRTDGSAFEAVFDGNVITKSGVK